MDHWDPGPAEPSSPVAGSRPPPSAGPPAEPGHPAGETARLHPLTPLALGARVLSLLVVILLTQVESHSGQNSQSTVVTLLVVGSLTVLVALRGLIAFLTTRYWVDSGGSRVDSGLLSRRHKRVRLNRVQSVDVLKPLAARLFGLAELRITTAGTERTAVRLRFLAEAVAQQLRADLLGRGAGLGQGVDEAPEQPLVVVPPRALVLSSVLQALSWRLLLLLIGPTLTVLGASSASSGTVSGPGGHGAATGVGAALTVSTVLIVGHSIFRRVTHLWNFTVAESPDGLRIRHGLFSTSAQTVPTGRVQAIRIHQPLLWRPFGWTTIQMNVAGYAGKRESQNTVLLPVAPRPFAEWLASRVIGADVSAVVVTPPPNRAALRAPAWWRRESAGSDDRVFVTRHGLLSRTVAVVPHERTQSVHLAAGPWQRMLRLASVELDSTRGPVKVRARFRDEHEARAILDQQAERGRLARQRGAARTRATQDRPVPI